MRLDEFRRLAGMASVTLTKLEYSTDVSGTLRLYLYGADGYHRGSQRFSQTPAEGEISPATARRWAENAIRQLLEVKVCNSGDELLFHAVGGKVVYPEDTEAFWRIAGA